MAHVVGLVGNPKWEEKKHPRGNHGKFAHKPGGSIGGMVQDLTGTPPKIGGIKGKTPPKSFKFYSPGYKPKPHTTIKGANASSDGLKLWQMKKAGHFDNDYEYWLAAGKLASDYKKKHPSDAATPHSIVNAAFHMEMNDTGKLSIGPGAYGDVGTQPVSAPEAEKHLHGTTSTGIKTVSKFLAPGDMKPTGKKMPGVNGALVYKDHKGNDWLVKFPGGSKGTSQAYSNSKFLVDLDVATSRIQNKAGLPVPSIHAKTIDGKLASVHKMYSRVQEPFHDGMGIDLNDLTDTEIVEIQKNMVLDWLLSNHDAHSGNFLQTDKGIIGIDKGQSFKYFGKDKLSVHFGSDLNPPLAPNKPVYSTLMHQAQMGDGKMDFNNPEVQKTIQRLQDIPDEEYKDLLRPYAEQASKAGLLSYPDKLTMDSQEVSVNKFLIRAVKRKNSLATDFAKLNNEINGSSDTSVPSWASDVNVSSTMKAMMDSYKNGEYTDKSDFLGEMYSDADFTPEQEAYLKDWLDTQGEPGQSGPGLGSVPKMTPKKVAVKANMHGLKVGDAVTIHEPQGKYDAVISEYMPVTTTGTVDEIKGKKLTIKNESGWHTFTKVDGGYSTVTGKEAQISPSAPTATGVKIPGELAKDKSAVVMGDYLSVNGGKPAKVVGVSYSFISLEDGSLVGATEFDMGHVEWAAEPGGSTVTAANFNEGDTFTYNGDPWTVLKAGKNALKAENQVYFNAKIFSNKDLQSVVSDKSKQNSGVPKGYKVVQHPTMPEKYTIQKPNGEFSKTPDGIVKSWDTPVDAQESSVMKKYKNQEIQQAAGASAGAIAMAQSAPVTGPNPPAGFNWISYEKIKDKIAAGEDFTPEEYAELKNGIAKLKDTKKAAGAAQIEDDPGGFEFHPPTAKSATTTKTKGGFKEKPKFKMHGGAPPALSSAKGPNAMPDGQKLWEMKKAGQIQDDFKMWSEAKKLAAKAKKDALKKNPNAQAGVDYSSANQIRNVAMRLEFDETGDVKFETALEKTSEEVGQSLGQIKATNKLHEHVPVVAASEKHLFATHAGTFPGAFDKDAAVGSYFNLHSFNKDQSMAALQEYGFKYTDHSGWKQEQKSAWYAFSGSASTDINTFFRTGDVGMYGNKSTAQKYAKGIVDAFKSDNVKPLDDWTLASRGTAGGWELGIPSDAVDFDQMKAMEGKVVRNKCPVSSSLGEKPPWGTYRITYKLPPGFRGLGLYGKSAHPGEGEMMLPPGMAYRILKVEKGTKYQAEVLVEVLNVKLPEIEAT